MVLFERTDGKEVYITMIICRRQVKTRGKHWSAILNRGILYSFALVGSWKEPMYQLLGILNTVIRLNFRVMSLRSVVGFGSPFLHWFLLANSISNWLRSLVWLTYNVHHTVCCTHLFLFLINDVKFLIWFFQFDYLKSLEIEEKINKIRWCETANNSLFLLSTNDKTVKLWKVRFVFGYWIYFFPTLIPCKICETV